MPALVDAYGFAFGFIAGAAFVVALAWWTAEPCAAEMRRCLVVNEAAACSSHLRALPACRGG